MVLNWQRRYQALSTAAIVASTLIVWAAGPSTPTPPPPECDGTTGASRIEGLPYMPPPVVAVPGARGMLQIMSGSSPGPIIAGSTSYTCLLGGFHSSFGDEESILDVVGIACTVRNIFLNLDIAPGLGAGWTFTVRVNQVDTAVVITILDLNTFGSYTGPDLDLAVGNVVSVRIDPIGVPASTVFNHFSYELENGDSTQAIFFGASSAGTINTSTPRFSGVLNHLSQWERVVDGAPETVWNINPLDGVINGYRLVFTRGLPNGAVLSCTFTIYKSTDNGATFVAQDGSGGTPDTRLVAAGVGHLSQQAVTFSLPTSRGDLLYMRSDVGSTGLAQWSVGTCLFFVSSEANHFPICGNSNGTMNRTIPQYVPIFDPQSVTYGNVETGDHISDAGYTDFSLGREIVRVSTPPGAGNSWDFITRLNGISQTLQVNISGDTDTVGEDVIHSVPLTFGDTFGLQNVPTSSPIAARSIWGYVQATAGGASCPGETNGVRDDGLPYSSLTPAPCEGLGVTGVTKTGV